MYFWVYNIYEVKFTAELAQRPKRKQWKYIAISFFGMWAVCVK